MKRFAAALTAVVLLSPVTTFLMICLIGMWPSEEWVDEEWDDFDDETYPQGSAT